MKIQDIKNLISTLSTKKLSLDLLKRNHLIIKVPCEKFIPIVRLLSKSKGIQIEVVYDNEIWFKMDGILFCLQKYNSEISHVELIIRIK